MSNTDRPTCALYAIHLSIRPGTRLQPPSYFSEAKKRTFFATFFTPIGAVEAFNRAVSYGSWPPDAEPEVRDLIEGTVVYFRRHDGAWARPIAEASRIDNY